MVEDPACEVVEVLSRPHGGLGRDPGVKMRRVRRGRGGSRLEWRVRRGRGKEKERRHERRRQAETIIVSRSRSGYKQSLLNPNVNNAETQCDRCIVCLPLHVGQALLLAGVCLEIQRATRGIGQNTLCEAKKIENIVMLELMKYYERR